MFKKLVKRFYFINNNYLNLLNKLEIQKKILLKKEKEHLENLLNIINYKIINEEELELEKYLIELNNYYNFLYKKTFF